MIVAGLDVATTTGLAILEGDKCLHWEAHRPKGKEDSEIFHGYRAWLRSTLVAFGVEHVGMEEPLLRTWRRRRSSSLNRMPSPPRPARSSGQ